MMKTLAELNGKIVSLAGRPNRNDCLLFDCPVCEGVSRSHCILVSFMQPSLFQNGFVWTRTVTASSGDGRVESFSLSPSINCDVPFKDADGVEHPSLCKFHGWVTNGMVSW